MEITARAPDQDGSTPKVDLVALRAVIDSVVIGAHGLSVFDVELAGTLLRVFIERPAREDEPLAGVTLEDCVGVSRDLSTALDIADLIPHAYNLEVSSPGLNRPLRTAADFKRQVGKLAKVKLHRAASDGQLALRGVILAAAEGAVSMEVDGKRFEVPYDNVREAKLVFELGDKPPPGRPKRKKGKRRK